MISINLEQIANVLRGQTIDINAGAITVPVRIKAVDMTSSPIGVISISIDAEIPNGGVVQPISCHTTMDLSAVQAPVHTFSNHVAVGSLMQLIVDALSKTVFSELYEDSLLEQFKGIAAATNPYDVSKLKDY